MYREPAEWSADLDCSRKVQWQNRLRPHLLGWNVNDRALQGKPPCVQSAKVLGTQTSNLLLTCTSVLSSACKCHCSHNYHPCNTFQSKTVRPKSRREIINHITPCFCEEITAVHAHWLWLVAGIISL